MDETLAWKVIWCAVGGLILTLLVIPWDTWDAEQVQSGDSLRVGSLVERYDEETDTYTRTAVSSMRSESDSSIWTTLFDSETGERHITGVRRHVDRKW